jgi:hypothetical protein
MRTTSHRRRFHTDRVVAARRARYQREASGAGDPSQQRLSYGALADRDPWDCGRRCLLCHGEKHLAPRRSRERVRWRREWDLE